MKMQHGMYLVGAFIESGSETNQKGDINYYFVMTTGGRRGAVGVKYDIANHDFQEFLSALSIGDEIGARVTASAFKDAIYYTLQELTLLEEA